MSGDEAGPVEGEAASGAEGAGVELAPGDLPPDTLRRVVEEFITREGTDYGLHEVDLESKVADVMRQLDRGEAKVVFDPGTESVTLVVVR